MPQLQKVQEEKVQRFTLSERVIHWAIALTFVYAMLTGLALFTPHLYWLAYVLGGGTTIRQWHPIIGVVFFVLLLRMYLMWRRDMKIDAQDKVWMKNVGKYIRNEESEVDVGRFNAGQKQLFWVQVVAGVLLLASGIPLWFPHSFGEGVRL